MAVKRLTETGVERISSPKTGRIEISDELVTGLQFRLTSAGVKSWYHIYRFGGMQRRMFIGHYPDVPLLKARTIVRNAKQELALGNDPFGMRQEKIFQQIRKQEDGITVEQLGRDCIERHWKVNNRTWKATQQLLENHIFPFMGTMVAKDVRRKDVVARIDEIASSERPSAANHALVAMRKMYNWGIQRDIVEFNPCTNIKKPVAIRERERVLTRDEIRKLWQVCEDIGYPYGPVMQLLLLTGQRRSEIARLRWNYIDLEEKILRLPPETVKANRGHDIPLSDMAMDILQRLPRFEGPFVFTMTHGAKAIDGFGKSKVLIDKKFGTDDWRIHDLRRTAATCMAELGVPIPTISRILNHAEGGVTRIYARYSFLTEKRQALTLWAQHVSNLVTGGDHPNVVNLREAL